MDLITKDSNYCCDKCKYYRMIDSGYGHCIAMPPQWISYKSNIQSPITGLFTKPEMQCIYPEVRWDTLPCGFYKQNS
jgi:hypothetical protein